MAAIHLKKAPTAPAEPTPEGNYNQNTDGQTLAVGSLQVTGDTTTAPQKEADSACTIHTEAFCEPITTQCGIHQEMAETSISLEQSCSRDLTAHLPHLERGLQISCQLPIRPQCCERGEVTIAMANDSEAKPVTQDPPLKDMMLLHQRPSSSRAATPKTTPDLPPGDATPYHVQPWGESTTATRPGWQLYEHELVIDRRSGHDWNQESILRYRICCYGYDPSGDTSEPIAHLPR